MDAAEWDARYDTDELVWSGEPNQFLAPEVEGLSPGASLDLACGEGRNSVWLAGLGWTTTGIDHSAVAIAKAERLADERGVAGSWIVGDVTSWEPQPGAFDLVIAFYLQLPAAERRRAVQAAVTALAPDGTFLFVAHDLLNLTEGHGGPKDATVLTTAEAIVDDLAAASLSSGAELVIERAEQVHRVVVTDEGEVNAIDTLVRARRLDVPSGTLGDLAVGP
jgi:SAM-dependent methyltransferase